MKAVSRRSSGTATSQAGFSHVDKRGNSRTAEFGLLPKGIAEIAENEESVGCLNPANLQSAHENRTGGTREDAAGEGEALKPSELLQDFHLVDTVNGVIAKFLLNAEELVVFRNSV